MLTQLSLDSDRAQGAVKPIYGLVVTKSASTNRNFPGENQGEIMVPSLVISPGNSRNIVMDVEESKVICVENDI